MCYGEATVKKTHIDSITIGRDHATDKLSVTAQFRLIDTHGDTIRTDTVDLTKDNGFLFAAPDGFGRTMREFASELHYLLDKALVSGTLFSNRYDVFHIEDKLRHVTRPVPPDMGFLKGIGHAIKKRMERL